MAILDSFLYVYQRVNSVVSLVNTKPFLHPRRILFFGLPDMSDLSNMSTNDMIWVWVNTYRYHFQGDEHPFTSYFDVHQGYKVLTHSHMTSTSHWSTVFGWEDNNEQTFCSNFKCCWDGPHNFKREVRWQTRKNKLYLSFYQKKRRYDCVYLTLVIYDCRLENPACVDGFPVDIDDLLASLISSL